MFPTCVGKSNPLSSIQPCLDRASGPKSGLSYNSDILIQGKNIVIADKSLFCRPDSHIIMGVNFPLIFFNSTSYGSTGSEITRIDKKSCLVFFTDVKLRSRIDEIHLTSIEVLGTIEEHFFLFDSPIQTRQGP